MTGEPAFVVTFVEGKRCPIPMRYLLGRDSGFLVRIDNLIRGAHAWHMETFADGVKMCSGIIEGHPLHYVNRAELVDDDGFVHRYEPSRRTDLFVVRAGDNLVKSVQPIGAGS